MRAVSSALLQDSVALVWLADRRQLGKAVAALQANASALGIDTVIYGQELVKQGLAPALRGHRQPDIIAKVHTEKITAVVTLDFACTFAPGFHSQQLQSC